MIGFNIFPQWFNNWFLILCKHYSLRPTACLILCDHVVVSWTSVGDIKHCCKPNPYHSFPQFSLALVAALLGFHGSRRFSLRWLSCVLIQCCICHQCVVLKDIPNGLFLTLQLMEIVGSIDLLSVNISFHYPGGLQSVPVFFAVLVACFCVRFLPCRMFESSLA